jgi:chromosomal replication initiation ATPase DnaA
MQDFKNYNELRAHYMAVRKRLGGLGKSAGLVPIRPPEVPKIVLAVVEENHEVVFKVDSIPNNNFSKLLIKIAQKHSVDPNSLIVPNHKPEVVKIRREVAYFAVKDLKYSASQVGRWLKRDHKTVLYDIKCYERDNAQTA